MAEAERNPRSGDQEIDEILKTARTIAVVGLSPNPDRPSNEVASYLKGAGFRIIPVNPGQKEILGERCYASVAEIPEPVDVVDVFRAPEAVPPVVDDAVRAKAKAVWLQVGIVHEEAARKARAAGLKVVMDRCMMVEHRKRAR